MPFPALGELELKVVFSLGVDPMETILSNVVGQYLDAAMSANPKPIEVPYSVRGTVWFNVPAGLGRIGLPFGPQSSTWQLSQ